SSNAARLMRRDAGGTLDTNRGVRQRPSRTNVLITLLFAIAHSRMLTDSFSTRSEPKRKAYVQLELRTHLQTCPPDRGRGCRGISQRSKSSSTSCESRPVHDRCLERQTTKVSES